MNTDQQIYKINESLNPPYREEPLPVATRILEGILNIPGACLTFIRDHLVNISAHTLGWFTIIMLHLSSVPTLLAVLTNQSDRMPPVDIMLFVWGGLTAVFFKSLFERNYLYVATNCLGFVGQTILMSLILFK
jgi:hypothetical protein